MCLAMNDWCTPWWPAPAASTTRCCWLQPTTGRCHRRESTWRYCRCSGSRVAQWSSPRSTARLPAARRHFVARSSRCCWARRSPARPSSRCRLSRAPASPICAPCSLVPPESQRPAPTTGRPRHPRSGSPSTVRSPSRAQARSPPVPFTRAVCAWATNSRSRPFPMASRSPRGYAASMRRISRSIGRTPGNAARWRLSACRATW